METTSFRRWFSSKVDIADEIVAKHGLYSEPDAQILLCCAVSSLAAQMWPGSYLDKNRFTQFLIEFAPRSTRLETISVPVLVAKLTAQGDNSSAIALKSKFFPSHESQVVESSDVDHPEEIVSQVVPTISLKDLRECSHAGIIYLDLRCGLVHEYRLPLYMKSFRHSDRLDVPNYVNMIVEPDPETVRRVAREFDLSEDQASVTVARIRRHLHLPYLYVRKALVSAADQGFDYWDTVNTWSRPQPVSWWIQG